MEAHKDIAGEKPGKCPECGMNLVAVVETQPDSAEFYACPECSLSKKLYTAAYCHHKIVPELSNSSLLFGGHNRDILLFRPVDHILRMAVADAFLVPADGPDHMESTFPVRYNTGIVHQGNRSQKGAIVVERHPSETVLTISQMQSIFTIIFEI